MLVLSPNGYIAECYVNFKAHENDTKVFFFSSIFKYLTIKKNQFLKDIRTMFRNGS